MLLHASCVSLDGAGLLLLGVPGSGKSSLALRLMERGWSLVADDQVEVSAQDGQLAASPPQALAGRLEVRGLGVFEALAYAPCTLTLVARLRPAGTIPRLPAPSRWRAHGLDLPEFPLDAMDVAAPERAAWAMRAAQGALTQQAGSFAP